MRKCFLTLVFLLFFLVKAYSTFLASGQFVAQPLGNGKYYLVLIRYRDCNENIFPQSAKIKVYGCSNYFYRTLPALNFGNYFLNTNFCNNLPTNCQGGQWPANERAFYGDTITLPLSCDSIFIDFYGIGIGLTANYYVYSYFRIRLMVNTNYVNDTPLYFASDYDGAYLQNNEWNKINLNPVFPECDSLVFDVIPSVDSAGISNFNAFYNPQHIIDSLEVNPENGDFFVKSNWPNVYYLTFSGKNYRNGELHSCNEMGLYFTFINDTSSSVNIYSGSIYNVIGAAVQISENEVAVCPGGHFQFNTAYVSADPSDSIIANSGIDTMFLASTTSSGGYNPALFQMGWTAPNYTCTRHFVIQTIDRNCPLKHMAGFGYTIYVRPLDTIQPSLIFNQDTLYCTPFGTGCNWFINGNPVPGSMPYIIPNVSGSYSASVNFGNCTSMMSDTINITVNGLHRNKPIEQHFIFFPNPAGESIFVENNSGQQLIGEVFNEQGSMLLRFETQRESIKIDISMLQNGIYSLRFYENGNYFYKKLIIIRP